MYHSLIVRITVGALGAVIVGLTLLFAISEFQLRQTYSLPSKTLKFDPHATVPEGARIAKLYGCTSCHGPDYRGLRYNDDPNLVQQYAPNLTRLAAKHSDSELAQAIRSGVSASNGRALWGMPSATFNSITDAEMSAVLMHLRSLPVGGKVMPTNPVSFRARLSIVLGVIGTKGSVQKPAPKLMAEAQMRPPLDLGPKHAAGRHIAATVCSECHGSDLSGNAIEGGTNLAIVGGYDLEAFRHLLRTGVPPDGRNLGLMAATAREDLKVFTDAEIDALHKYLAARAEAGQYE